MKLGQSRGGEFRDLPRIARRSLMGLWVEALVDMVEGVGPRLFDVLVGVALHFGWPTDHSQQRWIGTEMNRRADDGEIGQPRSVASADEDQAFETGEGIDEIDALPWIHGRDIVPRHAFEIRMFR